MVAARACSWHGEVCTITWSKASYAQYLWRYAPGDDPARRFARALFVGVLARTRDGRVLLGRMAAGTSTPGRVQLPGGNVEPPSDGRALTVEAVRAHAVRELAEETGVRLPVDAVGVWAVKDRGAFGDVGIVVRADAPAAPVVRDTFARHLDALAAGEAPEFASLLAVRRDDRAASGVLPPELGPHVDYVPALLGAALGTAGLRASEWPPRAPGQAPRTRGGPIGGNRARQQSLPCGLARSLDQRPAACCPQRAGP